MEQERKLNVLAIIDPLLCLRCDFAHVADVVMKDGTKKKIFYCSRGDCDNWEIAEGTKTILVSSKTLPKPDYYVIDITECIACDFFRGFNPPREVNCTYSGICENRKITDKTNEVETKGPNDENGD